MGNKTINFQNKTEIIKNFSEICKLDPKFMIQIGTLFNDLGDIASIEHPKSNIVKRIIPVKLCACIEFVCK